MGEIPRDRIAEIARRRGLLLVLLHGSCASGRAHPESDIDIAIRAAQGPISFRDFIDTVADLQGAAEGKVDLVDLARADPLLLKKIFETAVPLFDAGGVFAAERLRAFHRYEDYRPFLRLERDAVRRALGLPALDADRP